MGLPWNCPRKIMAVCVHASSFVLNAFPFAYDKKSVRIGRHLLRSFLRAPVPLCQE